MFDDFKKSIHLEFTSIFSGSSSEAHRNHVVPILLIGTGMRQRMEWLSSNHVGSISPPHVPFSALSMERGTG